MSLDNPIHQSIGQTYGVDTSQSISQPSTAPLTKTSAAAMEAVIDVDATIEHGEEVVDVEATIQQNSSKTTESAAPAPTPALAEIPHANTSQAAEKANKTVRQHIESALSKLSDSKIMQSLKPSNMKTTLTDIKASIGSLPGMSAASNAAGAVFSKVQAALTANTAQGNKGVSNLTSLFANSSKATSTTISAPQMSAKAYTKAHTNDSGQTLVKPHKEAMAHILDEVKHSLGSSELTVTGVSAQSVRHESALGQNAVFNPNAKMTTTTSPFGADGLDQDVMVNFSDVDFGGKKGTETSFALEEILMHTSKELLGIQNNSVIPEQRTGGQGGVTAGAGQSHAQAIGGVKIDVKVNTGKDVIGPSGTSVGKFYGNNAEVIYNAFKSHAEASGKKYSPKEFAAELLKQGIVEKNDPPTTKTILCQVAPTLGARAGDIQNIKSKLTTVTNFLKENPGKALPEFMLQKQFIEKLEKQTGLTFSDDPVKVLETAIKQTCFANPQEVEDYFFAVDAGIEALVTAETASGKQASDIHYPGGWFGAGAFSNPGELVALSQMTLAGFRGINMVFHNVAFGDMVPKRAAQLEKAGQLYDTEIKPMLEKGATKAEILAKVQEIAAREKWPIGDLSLD